MKSSVKLLMVLCACQVALCAADSYAAGDPRARELYGASPHNESGDCTLCHVASKEKLDSWFTFTSTKRQLKSDHNELCRKCHGVSFGHGVGKKPAMNRENLPLSADGTINCALTCHNMHVVSADHPDQERLHLRIHVAKLCLSCHDK
jgi:hypothetical protein